MNRNSGFCICIAVLLLAAFAPSSLAVADDNPPPPWQQSPAAQAMAKAALAKAARDRAIADSDTADPQPDDDSPPQNARRRAKSPYRLAADETIEAPPEILPPGQIYSKTPNATPEAKLPPEVVPALPENSGNGGDMSHWKDPWDISNDDVSQLSPLGFQEGLFPHLFRESIKDRFWLESDLLAWSARGMATPALLTTSPTGTPTSEAGVIGQTGTKVLVGDQEIDSQFRTGVRVDLGAWLNAAHTVAIEASYLSIGKSTVNYDDSSSGTPILARPFFNSETGANDSQIIAYPSQSTGVFQVQATSDFQAAELVWRRMVAAGQYGRFDALVGYRCQQLSDTLDINENVGATGSGSTFPTGTSFHVHDEFDTHNFFNGVELGLANQYHYDRWSLDTTFKMGVGDVHSVADISGETQVAAPGASLAKYGAGLLALPSNEFGSPHHKDSLSIAPEISTSLGWQITRRLKLSFGYTFSYWTDVARPGDQIDTRLDPRQFAPPTAPGTTPGFHMHATDYWAQGGNAGLEYRF